MPNHILHDCHCERNVIQRGIQNWTHRSVLQSTLHHSRYAIEILHKKYCIFYKIYCIICIAKLHISISIMFAKKIFFGNQLGLLSIYRLHILHIGNIYFNFLHNITKHVSEPSSIYKSNEEPDTTRRLHSGVAVRCY